MKQNFNFETKCDNLRMIQLIIHNKGLLDL